MADLVRWDPFRDVVSLRDAMNRLLEESIEERLSGLSSLVCRNW